MEPSPTPNTHRPSGRALALHRSVAKSRDVPDEVELHYNLALKLRPNFALAALNLAAWQYGRRIRSPEQLEGLLVGRCARGMRPDESRAFHQHVQIQIECLISAARIHFDDHGAGDERSMTSTTTTKQTTAAGSCPKVAQWMSEARGLIRQIPAGTGRMRPLTWRLEPGLGLELSKQLAAISSIEAKCEPSGSRRRLELLEEAVGHSLASQVGGEANVYLDYLDQLTATTTRLSAEARSARLIQFVERELEKEKQIGQKGREQLVRLISELVASLKDAGDLQAAWEWVQRALIELPDEPSLLSAGGQLAYESGRLADSQRLFAEALRQLEGRDNGLCWGPEAEAGSGPPRRRRRRSGETELARRKLASAHANYGAILQVSRRLEEAREHYRRALDCDPRNGPAASNLARLADPRPSGGSRVEPAQ